MGHFTPSIRNKKSNYTGLEIPINKATWYSNIIRFLVGVIATTAGNDGYFTVNNCY